MKRRCPGCSAQVGRVQLLCSECGQLLVAPVVVRWLKAAAAVLLLSGPVAFLLVHTAKGELEYNRSVDLGWLAIAVVVIAVGWVRPRVIGWLLLPVSVGMLLLSIFVIEFGHGWTGDLWSMADVLLVAFLAGVPLLAGAAFLVAGLAIRPWLGVVVAAALVGIVGYAAVTVPGAGLPESSQALASPSWSRDGTRLAFEQTTSNYKEIESHGYSWSYASEIFVVNADGTGMRSLTRTPQRFESCPVWSPSGDEIVFVGEDEQGNRDLFLIAADGSNLRRLTRSANLDEHSPSWSPDGKRIAFVRTGVQEEELAEGEWIGEIHVINADGTGQRRLTTGGDEAEDSSPVWSPDGRNIAFSRGYGRSAVIVMDADGTNRRSISGRLKGAHSPGWSPDGRRIAFVNSWDIFDLFVVNADGSDLRKITHSDVTESVREHSWSPDGARLVYRQGHQRGDETVGDLVVVAADGTNGRNLTGNAVDESDPGWSPDGTWIAYVRSDTEIWLIHPDGSEQRRLVDLPEEHA